MASFHLVKNRRIQHRKQTTKYLKHKQNQNNQSESEDHNADECLEIKEHFEYRLNKTPELVELTGPLNVIECMINFPLFQKNLFQKRYGKAYKCALASTSSVQNVAPNAWTAIAYDIRAKMYEIHAHVTPQAKEKHLKSALDCYRIAREHVLIQPCQEDQNCVLKIIFLTLQMAFLALKLPCLSTVNILGNKNIVAEPLSICTLTKNDLKNAESMLDTVKKQLQPIEATGYAHRLTEEIKICDICIEIRKAQMMMQFSDYRQALDAVIIAEKVYREWDYCYSKDDISQNVKSPVLKIEMSAIIQNIKAHVLLLIQEASKQKRQEINKKVENLPPDNKLNSNDIKETSTQGQDLTGNNGLPDSTSAINNPHDTLCCEASVPNMVSSRFNDGCLDYKNGKGEKVSSNMDTLCFGDNEKETISSSDINEASSNFESQESDVLDGY